MINRAGMSYRVGFRQGRIQGPKYQFSWEFITMKHNNASSVASGLTLGPEMVMLLSIRS